MIKFVFGLLLIGGGFFLTLFYHPIWGIYLFAALSHIRLTQLGENIALPLQVPMAIAGLTLVMYLLSGQYEKKFSKWPVEAWLFGLLVIGMGISSSDVEFRPDISWQYTIEFFKYWVFFLLLVNMIDSQAKLEWFHRMMILSAAWLVYRCWDLRGTTGVRFENLGGGNVEDANHFAAALVLLFPFVFLKTFNKNRWVKLGAAVLCFGIIMAIFISGSRGGMLGVGALVVFIILGFKAQRKKVLIAALLLGIVSFSLLNDYQKERFIQIFSSTSQEQRDDSAQGRIDYWMLSLELFQENMLTGVGYGNFLYYSGHRVEALGYGEPGHVTHGLFFEALAAGGIVVIVPLLMLFLRFFKTTKQTLQLLRKEGREDEALYVVTVRIALGAFLVSAMFLDRLIYEPIYWCIGLGVIHSYLLSQPEPVASTSSDLRTQMKSGERCEQR